MVADLFAEYPDRPGWKAEATSAQAAEAIAPVAPLLRRRCLDVFACDGALTADEVAARLGASILSVRPRISELKRLGKIRRVDGVRRPNQSGNSAAVWEAVP